jgi:hypothetical protein
MSLHDCAAVFCLSNARQHKIWQGGTPHRNQQRPHHTCRSTPGAVTRQQSPLHNTQLPNHVPILSFSWKTWQITRESLKGSRKMGRPTRNQIPLPNPSFRQRSARLLALYLYICLLKTQLLQKQRLGHPHDSMREATWESQQFSPVFQRADNTSPPHFRNYKLVDTTRREMQPEVHHDRHNHWNCERLTSLTWLSPTVTDCQCEYLTPWCGIVVFGNRLM